MIDPKKIPLVDVTLRFPGGSRPANSTTGPAVERVEAEHPHTSLINGAAWRSRTSIRAKRIIVGMDFSRASESARRLAIAIALASDALVDIVHVLDAFTETFVRNNADVIDKADGILAEIDHALSRRRRMAQVQGIRCVSTSLVGAPGLELASHAELTKADLMVLGDADEEPGRFGCTWGRRAADQILKSSRWRGLILLRPG